MYENAPFALLMFSDIRMLTFLYAIESLISNNFHIILLYCIGNMWLYWYFQHFIMMFENELIENIGGLHRNSLLHIINAEGEEEDSVTHKSVV